MNSFGKHCGNPGPTEDSSVTDVTSFVRVNWPGLWPHGWHTWANVKEAHRRLADEFAGQISVPASCGFGRGIVTCAGGSKYFPSAYVLVRRLRDLGCTLPVEVWHLGVGEVDPHMRRILGGHGATFVDARAFAMFHPWRILNGWECKPFAVLNSCFREVLFIDADCVPDYNPEVFFECPAYRETGSVFFPDYPTWTLDESVWETVGMRPERLLVAKVAPAQVRDTFGKTFPEGHSAPFESGEFLVDKSRCWRELRMAGWYCEHSDFYFKHFHGDKEAFRLGWLKFRTAYGMPNTWPGFIDPHTIIQYDFGGEPCFYHRTLDKWSLHAKNRRAAQEFAVEDDLFVYAHDLAALWKGRPWHNTAPSVAESFLHGRLAGKRVSYKRVGHDERTFDLLPNGKVGTRAAEMEQSWSAWVDGGEAVLAVLGGDGVTCVCRLGPDGVWRGHWVGHEQMPVEITVVGDTPAETARAQATLVGVVMPVVVQSQVMLDMTLSAAAGLRDQGCNVKLYVMANRLRLDGLDEAKFTRLLRDRAKREVVVVPGDRCVAASWNEGFRLAMADGASLLAVLANDAFLAPGALAEMAKFAGQEWPLASVWSGVNRKEVWDGPDEVRPGCDFTFAMLRPDALRRHGWFDENFKPAYYEDNDMYNRIILSGRGCYKVRAAVFDHVGSATIHNDPEMAHHVQHWWEANRAYYKQKWGVDAPPLSDDEIIKRCYHHPYNEDDKPLWFWRGESVK
jgi:hypothetical protein